MTAVEWLVEEFKKRLIGDDLPDWVLEIIDKAKDMEDSQVIKYIRTGNEYLEWKNEKGR